jgi:hypothetical protein
MSLALSFDVIRHREVSAMLKNPVAIPYMPSPQWLLLLQAPSINVVLHHTADCQAIQCTVGRCKQMNISREKTPDHQQVSKRRGVG